MKIRILTILLTISMLLLLTVSCDNANSVENKTDETIADTENNKKTEAEINNSQNSGNSGNNTSDGEHLGDTIVIDIHNYDDYLLFSKGIFDEEKYPFSKYYYNMFSSPQNALIDIKAVFGVPELADNTDEQIIIQDGDKFYYTRNYRIKVGDRIKHLKAIDVYSSYHPGKIQSYPDEIVNAPKLECLKERTEDMKAVKIQVDDCLLGYYWYSDTWYSVTFYWDSYRITIVFGSNLENFAMLVKNPAEINDTCGELIASLFSENTEDIKAAAETIKSRLPN